MSPVDPHRRATDHDEPTNRQILDRLDDFMAEHRRDHSKLEERLATHDVETAKREALVAQLSNVAPEVQSLREFRVEVKTASAMVKYILGGSLLAALASIVSLAATFLHAIQ